MVSGSFISFDYFDLPEIPTFVLCNPNMEQLFSLGGISERKYKARLTTFSELEFRADQYIDGKLMEYYQYLAYRRLVLVEGLGYFMIVGVEEESDGIRQYKNVSCHSIEAELNTKKVNSFVRSDPIQFWNPISASSGLMNIVMEKYIPAWGLTIHDIEGVSASLVASGSLVDRYRSIDTSDATLYTFLTSDISEAYGCVFTFDNTNKVVHAYEPSVLSQPTNIFISHNNVIENMKVEEAVDNLATAINVYGGGGLDISVINPLGTPTMYNFDYFMTESWMTPELIISIENWYQEVANQRPIYENYYIEYFDLTIAGGILDVEYTLLSGELEQLIIELNALIELGNDTTAKSAEVDAKQLEVTAKQDEITSNIASQNAKLGQMSAINDMLSFTNTANFPTAQYLQLQPFIIESTYINENFEQTPGMSASSITETSGSLSRQAEGILKGISEPRYRFDVNMSNIMMIKDFQVFRNQLSLGKTITVEITPGSYIYPILLGYDLNFDEPDDFKMLFGNRLHLDDDYFQYGDLMTEAFRSARKSQFNSALWNAGSNNTNVVNTFITSPINATTNNIINSPSRDLVIDSTGIKGRSSSTGNQQLWINNAISYTIDKWTTTNTAIGDVAFISGETAMPDSAKGIITGNAYGIVGDNIVGHIMADDELVICNSSGSFVISGSTVNVRIKARNGHNIIELNETDGIKITKDGGSILYLDTSGNLHITHS